MSKPVKVLLVVGGIFAALICLCVGSSLIGYFTTSQSINASKAKFGTMGEFCRTPSDTVTGTLPQLDAPKVVIFGLNSAVVDRRHSSVADAMRAEKAEDVDLIVCAGDYSEEQRTVLETCDYQTTGGETSTVSRIRIDFPVYVLDPATGNTLLKDVISGAHPDQCPDQIKENVTELVGDQPTDEAFQSWLQETLH
jgi:hypothetical protein